MIDSAEGSAVGTGRLVAREREVSRAASIVGGHDAAIIGVAPDGLIQTWNAGAELLYGYGPAETVGNHISTLQPPGREGEFAEALARVAAGKCVSDLEE